LAHGLHAHQPAGWPEPGEWATPDGGTSRPFRSPVASRRPSPVAGPAQPIAPRRNPHLKVAKERFRSSSPSRSVPTEPADPGTNGNRPAPRLARRHIHDPPAVESSAAPGGPHARRHTRRAAGGRAVASDPRSPVKRFSHRQEEFRTVLSWNPHFG